MDQKRRIMIFGATGYIGSNLIHSLANKSNYHLTLILKPGDRYTSPISKATIAVDYRDVRRLSDLKNLSYEVDTIIYLCGTKSRQLDEIKKIYVDAPKQILTCAVKRSPSVHFIMASNISVYGDQGENEVREDIVPHPNNSLGKLMLESERSLLQYYSNVSILRMPAVFGGNEKAVMPSPVIIGKGNNYMNFIWIQDLIQVLQKLSENPMAGVFNVSDNHPLSQQEAARLLSEWWGKETRTLPLEGARKLLPENTFGILTNSIKLNSSTILSTYHITPKTLKEFIVEED